MKTFWRYTMAAVGVVTLLVCIKLLILLPPENTDRYYKGKERPASILFWGGDDNHDQLKDYGHNNPRLTGEMGRGVVLPVEEKARGEEALKKYSVNVIASDLVSLNRLVPDSRPVGCESVQYADDLPSTAIVIPFHNEWPSVLLRTVYSIVNRTPKSLLKQIILVDDASNLKSLKDDLDHFIKEHFPEGLVKLVRMPERVGLIRARLEGFRYVTAEVVSFFDSHMEVNVDWLQPLLVEIVKDRRTVAMGHLDYILPDTFEYSYTPGYRTRYGFDWRLVFFETYFLKSQEKDKDVTDPLPGVVMVGPGFAIRSDYFSEIGVYDEGMKIWGGENLELAWRVWLCGGRLVHLACSKIGHIARPQPYSFPDGRYETEIHNYKRAVEVWMGPFKKFVYDRHPKMKDLDVGDLSERIALRDRLQCRNFTWYLKNVWPELYPYGDNATHWGGVRSMNEDLCLDNNEYLFLGPEPLQVKPCVYALESQSFSLTADKRLRTTLQCVGVREEGEDMAPMLITCQDEPTPTWTYTATRQLRHDQTGLCLQLMKGPKLMMQSCKQGEQAQMWKFPESGPPTSFFSDSKPAHALGDVAAKMKGPDGKDKSPRELLDEYQKQIMMMVNMQGQPGQMPTAGGAMMQPAGRNMIPPGGANMMPPGGANMMPSGGANMMHPEGANMMPPGGGNMMPSRGGNMSPQQSGEKIGAPAGMGWHGGAGKMMPGAGNALAGNAGPGGRMMAGGAASAAPAFGHNDRAGGRAVVNMKPMSAQDFMLQGQAGGNQQLQFQPQRSKRGAGGGGGGGFTTDNMQQMGFIDTGLAHNDKPLFADFGKNRQL